MNRYKFALFVCVRVSVEESRENYIEKNIT